MKRTYFIPLVLLVVGCAHQVKKPEYYQAKAKKEVEKMPRVFNIKDFDKKTADCPTAKDKKTCYQRYLVEIRAKINLAYPDADQRDVENYYNATAAEVLANEMSRLGKLYPTRVDQNREMIEAISAAEYYENIARSSFELNRAANLQNDAIARSQAEMAGWNAFANSLNQASTNLRLQQLEQKQRNTQWELDYQRRQNNQNYNGPVKVIGGY